LCLGTIADVCPYFLDGLVFWLRFDILAEKNTVVFPVWICGIDIFVWG
jgi:hypothetical protein